MIEATAGEFQAGGNIFRFEIRQFFKNLLLRETRSQQIEYIDDSNSHSTDAGPPTTLCRVDCDALDEFGHAGCFLTGKPSGYNAEQPDPVIQKASLLKTLSIINRSEKHWSERHKAEGARIR